METAIGIKATKEGRLRAATVAALVTLALSLVPSGLPGLAAPATTLRRISVIVRELPGAGDAPEAFVRRLGGHVERQIGIIQGFVAEIPAETVPELARGRGVHSVTPDARVTLHHVIDGFNAATDAGSMYRVTQDTVGARSFWSKGFTGDGVDIALIDSGVVPVDGLTSPGKVVNGPDLSFESQAHNLRYLDTFGHGTHLAGIMAGRDALATSPAQSSHDDFVGMAPGARVVSVKVADRSGAVDVSQVIAAIDWVVQHRNDDGLNIRVLNLSFGTDGVQDYRLDPLAYAAEVAWRKGIVVVVAAGNRGFGSEKLNNPAYDPHVIAVGGADGRGTYSIRDDTIAPWSSCGDGTRNPDLVAPGKSLVSLRAPGSDIDQRHPEGLVNGRFFRGSGTSQSAAVVSGAAALIIDQRPNITPNQLKKLLTKTASKLPQADLTCQGAGMIDLKTALGARTPSAITSTQTHPFSTGLGSLDEARGTARPMDGDVALAGEQDIFGASWDAAAWSGKSWIGTSWSGGDWMGTTWSGSGWTGTSWAGKTWSGVAWSGTTWSGKTWSGIDWSGKTWSGKTWSGGAWTNYGWNSSPWTGKTWSTGGWC